MVRSLRVLVAVIAAALMSAMMAPAPAQADESEFLRVLQPKYVYLSADQLLTAGYGACAAIESGQTSVDALGVVARDLSVSVATAFDIVATAVTRLDC